jgi:hypothetical protein
MVGYAYCTNIIPIGGPIMFVMDASDVLVALFKLTVDVYENIAFPVFLLMVSGWVYFRLWFFPAHVIWRLQEECYDGVCQNMQYSALNMLYAFMSGLVCLHIFWFYLMIAGLMKRMKSKSSLSQDIIIGSSTNRMNE